MLKGASRLLFLCLFSSLILWRFAHAAEHNFQLHSTGAKRLKSEILKNKLIRVKNQTSGRAEDADTAVFTAILAGSSDIHTMVRYCSAKVPVATAASDLG